MEELALQGLQHALLVMSVHSVATIGLNANPLLYLQEIRDRMANALALDEQA